jgi:hypothetical protein
VLIIVTYLEERLCGNAESPEKFAAGRCMITYISTLRTRFIVLVPCAVQKLATRVSAEVAQATTLIQYTTVFLI